MRPTGSPHTRDSGCRVDVGGILIDHHRCSTFGMKPSSRHCYDRRTISTAVSASEAVVLGPAWAASADEHCRK